MRKTRTHKQPHLCNSVFPCVWPVKQDAGLTDKYIQNMFSSSAGYLIVYLVILLQLFSKPDNSIYYFPQTGGNLNIFPKHKEQFCFVFKYFTATEPTHEVLSAPKTCCSSQHLAHPNVLCSQLNETSSCIWELLKRDSLEFSILKTPDNLHNPQSVQFTALSPRFFTKI